MFIITGWSATKMSKILIIRIVPFSHDRSHIYLMTSLANFLNGVEAEVSSYTRGQFLYKCLENLGTVRPEGILSYLKISQNHTK